MPDALPVAQPTVSKHRMSWFDSKHIYTTETTENRKHYYTMMSDSWHDDTITIKVNMNTSLTELGHATQLNTHTYTHIHRQVHCTKRLAADRPITHNINALTSIFLHNNHGLRARSTTGIRSNLYGLLESVWYGIVEFNVTLDTV